MRSSGVYIVHSVCLYMYIVHRVCLYMYIVCTYLYRHTHYMYTFEVLGCVPTSIDTLTSVYPQV